MIILFVYLVFDKMVDSLVMGSNGMYVTYVCVPISHTFIQFVPVWPGCFSQCLIMN